MDGIYRYAAEHSSRASEALAWLERQTNIRTNHARMLSGSVQGELLRLLVLMSGATHILELGTFTGYSAICLASALPEDGFLDTLEINDELEDLILEGFRRAGLEDRIGLHIGDCRKLLSAMPPDRIYDLVYMDANKRDYCEYYDLVFPHLKKGGWILADNVIWDGKVCADAPSNDRQTQSILRFNEMVAADPRVENVILPVRDGLNIIRKIV
ncbi:MAG: O-methyltransferase [Candidatus Cryptobacteroides sp.]